MVSPLSTPYGTIVLGRIRSTTAVLRQLLTLTGECGDYLIGRALTKAMVSAHCPSAMAEAKATTTTCTHRHDHHRGSDVVLGRIRRTTATVRQHHFVIILMILDHFGVIFGPFGILLAPCLFRNHVF
jgi:hypothetical protein